MSEVTRILIAIIAHELVHVFNHMRFIVPAFKNWRSFWHTFLCCGWKANVLHSRLRDLNLYVDCYGEKGELESLKEFWPSQAERWFRDTR